MAATALTEALERQGVLVLDGAMATELERHGADLSGGLWSARLLLEQPELIAQVHRDYFEAGADVAITASYQASVPGFAGVGLSRREAEQLLQRSVRLAMAARDEFWAANETSDRQRPLVATSVGPYGAVLADGSEYRGHYRVSHGDLVSFHRNRLAVLVDAGVEVLACETLPSLEEAEALVEALGAWPDVAAWVSFSAQDGQRVSDGTAAQECAGWLHEQEQVVAIGVNCSAVEHITPLLGELASATDKPLVTYPNSGEIWDATRQRWLGAPTAAGFETLAAQWYAAGARLIGGCCRTGPSDIRAISKALLPDRPATGRS
ncbi:MAG TPA: homocysteine S-methyltransferase [Propionibacteriaceae bacterium]|jgi:homocysteine S-methyltransferase